MCDIAFYDFVAFVGTAMLSQFLFAFDSRSQNIYGFLNSDSILSLTLQTYTCYIMTRTHEEFKQVRLA